VASAVNPQLDARLEVQALALVRRVGGGGADLAVSRLSVGEVRVGVVQVVSRQCCCVATGAVVERGEEGPDLVASSVGLLVGGRAPPTLASLSLLSPLTVARADPFPVLGAAPFPLPACPLPTSLPPPRWLRDLWLRLCVEDMLGGEVMGADRVGHVLDLRS
jgi:hypothetical protein